MTEKETVLKHLSSVYDPELGVNIVDLGMVKDVVFNGCEITIKLALTIADCPMRNQIENEIIRKLELIEGVESINIETTAMDQKDRSALMEKARKRQEKMLNLQKLILVHVF